MSQDRPIPDPAVALVSSTVAAWTLTGKMISTVGFPIVSCLILFYVVLVQFPMSLKEITIANTTALREASKEISGAVKTGSDDQIRAMTVSLQSMETNATGRTTTAVGDLRAEHAKMLDELRVIREDVKRLLDRDKK